MSVPATTAVWEHSKARGADLIVMLALADAANADGYNAHPGLERLQKWARRRRSAVLASIQRSVDRGELVRTAPGHRGHSTIYAIVLPGLDTWTDLMEKGPETRTDENPERVQESVGKGPGSSEKGSSLPISVPLVSTTGTSTNGARADRFEELWSAYPSRHGRKLAKGKAQEAWARLKPAERDAALVAVAHYARACGREETLAKDAFRWIRDKSFEDWLQPPEKQTSRYGEAPPAEWIRCPHGYPISEDTDGLLSACTDCDVVALERAASEARRAKIEAAG